MSKYRIDLEVGNEKEEVPQYVTAKTLREYLDTVDDNDIIVISKDATGTNFSPMCCGVTENKFNPETGEVGLRELDNFALEMGETEKSLGKGLYAITFYPQN